MVGFVTLLGAGPGDLDLLTVKGLACLKEADVLVFDRLVNQGLFAHLKKDCDLIDVGKQPGQPCMRQADIERILIEQAKQGKKVVRLKSGDPYVFGRGGEEGLALSQAGIDFEVVPGISSAIASLTYAGIPVTYRDIATSFHVFTGHLKDETESLNWQAISQLKGTLIFLMGMKNLPKISEELLLRGYAPETPVAIVEWGTYPQQRSIKSDLANIVSLAQEQDFRAPSIIVIGQVVEFHQALNFYESKPLLGRSILIQASATGRLPGLLKNDGANVLTFPMRNQHKALAFDLPKMEELTNVLITDSHSWSYFIKALTNRGLDLRQLAHVKFMALGQHTAQAMQAAGLILAKVFTQTEELSSCKDLLVSDGCYALAPDYKVKELSSYLSCPIISTHQTDFEQPLRTAGWDKIEAICLPNSAAALNFLTVKEAIDLDWENLPVLVMGASTRSILEKNGIQHVIESDQTTIVALRDKCREVLKGQGVAR